VWPKLSTSAGSYERADITSDQYYAWTTENIPVIQEGTFKAAAFLETFVAYRRARRRRASPVDQIFESVKERIEKAKQGAPQ